MKLQETLFDKVFKDRCTRCNLPSYAEIENPPTVMLPELKQEVGLACGFWLARGDLARSLSSEFKGQFELKKISDDSFFLFLNNVLIPDDPFYHNGGDYDPFFQNKEIICSQCGKPYILLHKGFINFKGSNMIRPKMIYETSLKFGTGDVKYPYYFCDKEAAETLRAISRKFKFTKSQVDMFLEDV